MRKTKGKFSNRYLLWMPCAVALATVLDYVFDLGGSLLTLTAMAVPAAVPAADTGADGGGTNQYQPGLRSESNPNGSADAPATGIGGLPTQNGGSATTVSNAREQAPDLMRPDVDTELVKIHSDFNVVDTIKRKVKKQKRVKSPIVEHWMIDEAKSSVTVAEDGKVSGNTLVIALEPEDANLLNPYYTCIDMSTGVEYYVTHVSSDGKITLEEVTEDGKPVVPHKLKGGDELILLASAAYETQKVIAPSSVYPVKDKIYLQKQLCNVVVSDYFDEHPKEIPFNEAQQAEAALNDFRHKSCRTAWIGKGGIKKVRAQNAQLNVQDVYMSKGLYWQFKRRYQLGKKIVFSDFINLAKSKTSRFGGLKKAAFIVGSELMADIQKIDFTLHADVTQKSSEVWGLAATQIHTVFCDIYLILDISLDECGLSKCGALIDMEQLVRYYMKTEETKKENVQDEEATRRIITTWDALALKGYTHIWVDGREVQQNNFVAIENIKTLETLPASPKVGDTVYLSADYTGSDGTEYEEGKAYTWNGESWDLASVELPTELIA